MFHMTARIMYTASAVQLVPTMMVAPLLLSVRKSRPNSKLLKISWVGTSIKSRFPRNWEKRPNTTREVAPVVAITKVAAPENKAIIRGKRTVRASPMPIIEETPQKNRRKRWYLKTIGGRRTCFPPILFYEEGHFMAHLQNRCEAITNIHYMYCL